MKTVAQLMREANPVPDPEAALTADEFDALLALTKARSGDMDVRQVETPTEGPKNQRNWLVAAAAFAVAVIIVGGVALLLSRNTTEPEPVAPEPASLGGNEWIVTGGKAQSRPDILQLGEDGAFQVIDRGKTVDSGTYTIDGDQISFLSVWVEGRTAEGYGIEWYDNDCPGCAVFSSKADKCEGLIGEYAIVREGSTTFTLNVVWDECMARNSVANGLQLELASGG